MEKITFNNSYESTRGGFRHTSEVYIDGVFMHKSKCSYSNRTWESYTFQSVMKNALHELIDARKAELKAEYKERFGVKRMSAIEVEYLANDDELVILLKDQRGKL
jgi:hypothetical protein